MAQATTSQEEQDRDTLAAEYVLGVLDLVARRRAEGLAASDPDFATLVDEWRERLSPMDDAFGETPPPPALRGRIEGRLFGANQDSGKFWRPIALAASFAFLALGGLFALQFAKPTAEAPRLIATLEAKNSPARFLALYEVATGNLRLTPVSVNAQSGKDFELWLVEGGNAPVSLGVLPDGGLVQISLPQALVPRFVAGAALAISVEPSGGSTTGAPTGPVIASGVAHSI